MKNIEKIKLKNFTGFETDLCQASLSYNEKVYNYKGEFEMVIEVKDMTFAHHIVHEDLVRCFVALSKHLSVICDQQSLDKFGEDESVCVCNQIVKSGEDENEGIVFGGFRKLSNGMQLNLVSPFFKFSTNNDYRFIEELYTSLAELTTEARELINTKKGRITQLELELSES